MYLSKKEDISAIQRMSLNKEEEAIRSLQKSGWEILLKNTLADKSIVIASWSPTYDSHIAAIVLACQRLGANYLVVALDAFSPDHGQEIEVITKLAKLADLLVIEHYNGAFAEKLLEIMEIHIIKAKVFESDNGSEPDIVSITALLKSILAPKVFMNDLVDRYLNARIFTQCVGCWRVETTFGWGDRPQKDIFSLSKVVCPRCNPRADRQIKLFSAE
ncbi:MAG: hypothetical protein Q7R75_00170 [bacterium]|nr:hypothetical protein [bacterium]